VTNSQPDGARQSVLVGGTFVASNLCRQVEYPPCITPSRFGPPVGWSKQCWRKPNFRREFGELVKPATLCLMWKCWKA